jgi:hypothetical protein
MSNPLEPAEIAWNAVRLVDRGEERREQAALSWLHEAGYYDRLTNDEAVALDRAVRRMCLALPAPGNCEYPL